MVLYNFPPTGGSGVQQSTKYVKYLPGLGWDPVVITPHAILLNQAKDRSLLQDIPPETIIYRTFMPDSRWLFKLLWGIKLPRVVDWICRTFFIPDPEVLWLIFAKRTIRRIVSEQHIALVFISGPPFSPMLLGKWIASNYQIPYILNFRDDWSLGQSRLDRFPGKRFLKIDRAMEHDALTHADHIVVVNKAYKSDFVSQYPEIPESRYSIITNGYDENDFTNSELNHQNKSIALNIVHPGALYGRRQPSLIWQALTNLANAGLIDPNVLRISIYGQNYASFVFQGFEDNDIIRRIVSLHPYLPHRQAIITMQQANLLLLFSGAGSKSDAVIPGKLFEYLRSGVPILGVINPHGVCAEVLRNSHSGFIADNANLNSIQDVILSIYNNWMHGELKINPDWEYIRTFERRNLTAKLAECFDHVLEKRS